MRTGDLNRANNSAKSKQDDPHLMKYRWAKRTPIFLCLQNCSIHVKSMFYIPKDRKILDLPTCALRFPQRRCADATSARKLSDNCDNVSPMSDSSDIVRQFQFEGAVPVAGLLPCSSTHRTANRCDGFCGHRPSSLARADARRSSWAGAHTSHPFA